MTESLKYALIINGPLYGTQNATSAYLFAQALIKKGHIIHRLFFYQAGVSNASMLSSPAGDEFNLHRAWCELAKRQKIELEVCVAAALRRGIVNAEEAELLELKANNLELPFVMTGLGQFAQALLKADRVLQF